MDIQKIVDNLYTKYDSTNPFLIAEQENITILNENLGSLLAYHNFVGSNHFIHLSIDLTDEISHFVCAHELGHSILHPEINAAFTLFPVGKYEYQANYFATLLLTKEAKIDYPDSSIFELAKIVGIPYRIINMLYNSGITI